MKGISWATAKASVQGLHRPKTCDGIGKIAMILASIFPKHHSWCSICRMQVVVVPYPAVPCHARSSFHLKIQSKRRWKIWKIWNWKSWKNWILFDLFVWFVNVSWRILPGCHGIHHHQSPFGEDLLRFPKPPTRKTRVLDPHEGTKRQRGKA